MSHPTKRPLAHGASAPVSSHASPALTTSEPAQPILEARFGVIAQALTGSTVATSAYSTIIPALQSFLSPAVTVTRGQVFGPTSTTASLPTSSPHPLQGLLIIDRSYPSISASPSSPAASDHWFPIESVVGYIELSDAYDEYELVRLRSSIDYLQKLTLQSDATRRTHIPIFHLCLASGNGSLASQQMILDLHVVAHSVALRFAHDTGVKGVFILNEGMVVRHDSLFPAGTAGITTSAPFVVARIKTTGHGPVLGLALLLAHALASVNNETSRNAHLIKQYAKASVWQATAPEPRSHSAPRNAPSSVMAATQAAAASVVQHVKRASQTFPTPSQPLLPTPQPIQQQQPPPPQQQQPPTQTQPSQPQQDPKNKRGRGKQQQQQQPSGAALTQTQPIKSRPQSGRNKKGEHDSKSNPSQQQQEKHQRPRSARTSMSATQQMEKKQRPATATPTTTATTATATTSEQTPSHDDDDTNDTDVRTDVDLTVVGTGVSGVIGDVKPETSNNNKNNNNKNKKQSEPKYQPKSGGSAPPPPTKDKPSTPNNRQSNGNQPQKSNPHNKRNNQKKRNSQQWVNKSQIHDEQKELTASAPGGVPLVLPSPPRSAAQVLAEKLLSPEKKQDEKKEAAAPTPYDDDFNPFA